MVDVGVCVSKVSEHLDVSLATASQFLAQLRDAGLLESERIGKFTYYTCLTPCLLGPVAASIAAVTIILFLFGLASLIGTHLGGRHADRRGHFHALVLGKTVHVLILVAIPFLAGSPWIAAGAIIVWSISAWSCSGSPTALIRKTAPRPWWRPPREHTHPLSRPEPPRTRIQP